MGFYGNVSAAQNTTFTFDRIYPNFALMSENCAVDGVYPGRYVLVEYDSALTIGSRGFMRVFRDGALYYIDKQHSQVVLYGENNTVNTITAGRLAFYTENENWDGLTEDPGLVTFLICNNTTDDIPGQTPAVFREIVTSDNRPYTINFNVDKNYLQFKKGARAQDIGRGFDSTVWQKVYIGGVEQYVQIAELNSVVPTFDIGMDAPTGFPVIPHWDTNSTTVYYKVHWQPQWGMRFKSANIQSGPKFLDDGNPVRNADAVWGDAETDYSTDETIYPSDETSTWIRKEYNKESQRYTYYYYAKKTETNPDSGETRETWGWFTAPELTHGDAEYDQDIPAAIYYNAAGFDSEYSHYSDDEPMVGEDNGWDGKDRVSMTPTGISGHVYQAHDGTIHKDVAEDIQEFSMMLPSIGNTIAKVWDIVYGDREQNGYVFNDSTGKWVLPSGETNFRRNRDIQWDSTRGLRAVTLDPESYGYKYDSNQVDTLAGVINSAHDLMGMIIVESDQPMNGEAVIRDADFGKIYYFTRDQKFCRKHVTYTYSGQTVEDYLWREVNLTSDTWHKNTYYYVDNNGNITAPLEGGGTVKLSADRLSAFDSNKTYYAKYIKQFSYSPLETDLIDYRPGVYYYRDPFGNYTLATEPTFFVDKNYYSINPGPQGPLHFDAAYTPGQYWYTLNNNYYLDNSEVIDGSRNYVDFEPVRTTKYIYGKGLYYYRDNNDYVLDIENDTADPNREYYVRTLIPNPENPEQYTVQFNPIGRLGGGSLVSYQQGVYYKRLVTQDEPAEGESWDAEQQAAHTHPYEYRVINDPDFAGETASLDYYLIDQATVTPAFLYVPNVYYYKDENTYYISYSSILSDTAEYYRINPESVVRADGFYKPNTYYIFNGTTYVLDSSLTKDHPYNEYFLRDTYYVFNDDLNLYSQGAVWNDVMNMIPSTIILGTRTPVYEMKEMPEFARGLNTLHGAILKMAQLMETGDMQTRDTSTFQGCLNSMNDVLAKFGDFGPSELVITDNYGRLRSAHETTEQAFSSVNYGKSSNNTTTLPAAEDRWIYFAMDDNAAEPLITMKHQFTAVTDTTTTANKNNGNGDGLNASNNDTLVLYTPIVDNMGHVVGKNIETVTLPYAFKTISVSNSTEDGAYSDGTTNNVEADSAKDTLALAAGNKWIRFATNTSNDTVTIAHETHSLSSDTSETDFNAQNAAVSFVVQDLTFDNAGHAIAGTAHTYKLPFAFKTISSENSTGTTWTEGTNNDIVADSPVDTVKFKGGNKWIRLASDTTNDALTIAHEIHNITTTGNTSTDLNTDSTTSINIPDWDYDAAGHITAKQSHSYTLPYNFKTITPDNTSNSWATSGVAGNTTSAVADSVYDTLTIKGGNNWIVLSGNNTNNDQIIISHSAPDVTAANLTDNTGSSSSNINTNIFGSTITIPTFKYDKAGHISSTNSFTVNIPGLEQTATASATGTGADVLTEFTLTAATSSDPTTKLQAKKRQAGSLLLTGYEAPQLGTVQAVAATDNINGAFSKLQNSINVLNAADTQTGSIAKSIKDAIDGLEYISSTEKPTDVILTDDGSTQTYYSNKTYIEIIKDLAARVAALENANS